MTGADMKAHQKVAARPQRSPELGEDRAHLIERGVDDRIPGQQPGKRRVSDVEVVERPDRKVQTGMPSCTAPSPSASTRAAKLSISAISSGDSADNPGISSAYEAATVS
jgi:hypothetical protein